MFIDYLSHGSTWWCLANVFHNQLVATERSEGGRTYVLNNGQSGLSPPTVKNNIVQGRRDQFLADTICIAAACFSYATGQGQAVDTCWLQETSTQVSLFTSRTMQPVYNLCLPSLSTRR